MIKYQLKCSKGHSYEAWFQNSEAYDKLSKAKLNVCEVCGDSHIEKDIMAPRLGASSETKKEGEYKDSLKEYYKQMSEQLKGARNVGNKFYDEVMGMYEGDKDLENIVGTATPDEFSKLDEKQIPYLKLPKSNS